MAKAIAARPCRLDRQGSLQWARGKQIDAANQWISRRKGVENLLGSAQRRILAKSRWQADYARASREEILEGSERVLWGTARPKNRECADA